MTKRHPNFRYFVQKICAKCVRRANGRPARQNRASAGRYLIIYNNVSPFCNRCRSEFVVVGRGLAPAVPQIQKCYEEKSP